MYGVLIYPQQNSRSRQGLGSSVKFADGKTSSAKVPHLNVWGFDISAAEFPQQKKARFWCEYALRAYSHQRRAFFRKTQREYLMLVFNWLLGRDQVKREIWPRRLAFFPSANFTLPPKRRPPTGPI